MKEESFETPTDHNIIHSQRMNDSLYFSFCQVVEQKQFQRKPKKILIQATDYKHMPIHALAEHKSKSKVGQSDQSWHQMISIF